MRRTRTLILTTTAIAAMTASLVSALPASADPDIGGTYNAVTAIRVLNTRSGLGAAKAPIGPGKTLTFNAAKPLAGKSVSAEAITVTAVNPTRGGHLVVYAAGATKPSVSSVSFQPKRSTPNLAVVPFGGNGAVSVYNASAGTVDLVADLTGYWSSGPISDTSGAYVPVPPSRVFDSRSANSPVGAAADLSVPATRNGTAIPNTGVSAILVELTAYAPEGRGALTATAAATDQQGAPRTSDVNFGPGLTRTSLVAVPFDPATDTISIHNTAGVPVNVLVDTVGYFTDGAPLEDGAFVSSTPYRNSDTRFSGAGLGAGDTSAFALVPGSDTPLFKAAVVTITGVLPSAQGYLTAWSGLRSRPNTSNLNFTPRLTTADEAIVPINPDGTISVYNGSSGSIDIVIDVHGFILNSLVGSDAAARAQVKSGLKDARRVATKNLR